MKIGNANWKVNIGQNTTAIFPLLQIIIDIADTMRIAIEINLDAVESVDAMNEDISANTPKIISFAYSDLKTSLRGVMLDRK